MSDPTTKKAAAKPATNDAAAGTKAQQYINGLYQALQSAENDYQTQQSILSKNQAQKASYEAKYTIALDHYNTLKNNQSLAIAAQNDVKTIVSFFSTQQSAVAEMVKNAKDASTNAYEALFFLIQQGIGRVDAINSLMSADNTSYNDKKTAGTLDPPNAPVPWVSSVTDAVGKAQASGAAAMEAGTTAVTAAFNAYAANQSILSRTNTYLNSFKNFEQQLNDLKNRLVKETAMAQQKSSLLKVQLDAITSRVDSLETLVDAKKTAFDEAQNKYNAAQSGASYAAGSPTS